MDAAFFQTLTSINFKSVIEFLSAAFTPVIGIATIYIAYQQWRTNKTRLDLDLYDRRLAIYKAVDAFYGEVGTHSTAKYPMVSELRHATAEAAFLFPAEIEKHLAEVKEKAMRIASLRELMYPSAGAGGQGLPVGEERNKAADEEGHLVLWLLQDAKPESKKRFGKYLKLT